MRVLTVCLVALSALLGPVAAFAQSFEVGPGGVRVYPDGRPRVYEERRVYEDRGYQRGYEDRGDRRGGDRLCRELRAACEYGERGEGNCRRYRRTCQ